jgi:peptidoglycan/LPS O-acetylase OafA/YrhL
MTDRYGRGEGNICQRRFIWVDGAERATLLPSRIPLESPGLAIEANSTKVSNRFDGIDLLRGLSIVAVVLHHINLRFVLNGVALEQALPKQLGKILFWNGANGVTVFFAISGFLITTVSLRRWGSPGSIQLPEFYRLRFARIAPLLVALLAALSALHLAKVPGFVISPERASLGRALFAALTFHINRLESVRGYLPASWDVLWSLSIEEVFYLFFPLICRLTKRRVALVAVLCGFVAIGPFARTILTSNELWADYGYLSCMDGIALGCLTAILGNAWRASRWQLQALRISGLLLMMLVMLARPLALWLHLYQLGLDFTLLALGTCLLMLAMAQENKVGRWPSGCLRWFGRHSYEIYLTHCFIMMWGIQTYLALGLAPLWGWAWYGLMLVLSAILGWVVARWYSEPMNRWLRKGLRFQKA